MHEDLPREGSLMHKFGAVQAPDSMRQAAQIKKQKHSHPICKSLIFKENSAVRLLRAIHRKHGVSRACRANPGDINKVIHSNSGFLANDIANQALAAQIVENTPPAFAALPQIQGFPGG